MFIKLLTLRLKKLFLIILRPKLLKVFLKYRVMAAIEHDILFKKDIKTLVDIGANRGQFSLAALSDFIKIYAFEPLPKPSRIFMEIFKNNTNVKFFEYAIGDFNGEVEMHVSQKDDSSSILEIASLQTEHFPGTEEVGLQKINVAPLKNFISPEEILSPSMIKLDVQGFELEALKGCFEFFEYFDYIYCECSFIKLYKDQSLASDIITYLKSYDYHISGIYNMQYDHSGNSIQADIFFTKYKSKD